MTRQLTIAHESWPIAGSFTIARGTKTSAEVVTVTLEQDGATGRGECVPYPRYGETGDLIVCNGTGDAVRAACRTAPLRWYGAWGTRSPDGAPVARTTYNPDFDFVVGMVRAVLLRDAEG